MRISTILALAVAVAGAAWYTLADSALLTEDQRAWRMFEAGDYDGAAATFRDPLWKGIATYEAKDFEAAAGILAGIDSADAAFAHGNALVFQGRYEDAAARYERALALRPGWEDARFNRDLALARAALIAREGGEGTDGMLGADDIDFSDRPSGDTEQTETTEATLPMDDAKMREIWLRQVQTRPADFLRWKFAWQQAHREDSR